MKTIRDMLEVEPSTSPALTAGQLTSLVGEPALHILPRHYPVMKLPTHSRLRPVSGGRIVLRSWDPGSLCFAEGGVEISAGELCENHWVHYLRLTRLACIHTQAAVLARTKTVSRRIGSHRFGEGQLVNLTDGTRRAGVAVLATVTVCSNVRVLLSQISVDDVRREGFPELSPLQFAREFKRINGIEPRYDPMVRRIEFEYL